MKVLWYSISLFLIILVLINNPKSEGVKGLNIQNKLFTANRKTTNTVEILTGLSVTIFLGLTVILSAYYEY
uniref:Probable protein-export membrane protein SecG n=1 Tax=Palmaria palmata TaxID=2822 RepID=A0A1C9CH04_PALPL|nr:preprotein translocase subunit G [Palmaria palmata]AOM67649.1 preprotein translocase subunit G [Palmaria palmata]